MRTGPQAAGEGARAEKSADCQAGTGDLSTIEGNVDALVDDVASALLR